MAGFIFSISKNAGKDEIGNIISEGIYSTCILNEDIKEDSKNLIATFADFCSMKEGDNVYFLSDRKIYGVGKLINIKEDCKYNNFSKATEFRKIEEHEVDEYLYKKSLDFRWICLFKPDPRFFYEGVDMDDVLLYKPNAFKMLRAFQNKSFIKIDDVENMALKQFLFLRNHNSTEFFDFNESFHKKISVMNLINYRIDTNKVFNENYENSEIKSEMLLEACIVDFLMKNKFMDENWDYITHQLIASPFKPINYMDKIDVFAYKFLNEFPDKNNRPIEKFLVLELKKDIADKNTINQLLKYVDWIAKEYASGDYSMITSGIIAKKYSSDTYLIMKKIAERSYIRTTHPPKNEVWNDMKLFCYDIVDEKIFINEFNEFNVKKYIKNYFDEIDFPVNQNSFQLKKRVFKPLVKNSKLKFAIFDCLSFEDEEILRKNCWKVFIIKNLSCENIQKELKSIIHQIIESTE